MTIANFIAFLSGFAVAGIILVSVGKAKDWCCFKVFYNKNGLENGLIVGALSLVVLSLVYDFGVNSGDGKITSAVISLIGSFLFSYLLTKRFSKKTYEEDLKEVASTAYRHNKSLLTKINYEIELIDSIFSQCTCVNKGGACENTHILYRIRDALIGFKRDAEENINDWSNIIPEEINAINMILQLQNKKNNLEYVRANTEEDIDISALDREITRIASELESYQKVIEEKPIFKIILESEKHHAEEMTDLIKKECDAKQSETIKNARNDSLKAKYDILWSLKKSDD